VVAFAFAGAFAGVASGLAGEPERARNRDSTSDIRFPPSRLHLGRLVPGEGEPVASDATREVPRRSSESSARQSPRSKRLGTQESTIR
jgi:hypothetical protein